MGTLASILVGVGFHLTFFGVDVGECWAPFYKFLVPIWVPFVIHFCICLTAKQCSNMQHNPHWDWGIYSPLAPRRQQGQRRHQRRQRRTTQQWEQEDGVRRRTDRQERGAERHLGQRQLAYACSQCHYLDIGSGSAGEGCPFCEESGERDDEPSLEELKST